MLAASDRLGRARAAQQIREERSGVVSMAMSFLGLHRDPVIAANTTQSGWRVDNCEGGA